MKKRLLFFLLILLVVSFIPYVFSHEEEEDYPLNPTEIYPFSQLAFVGYGSLVFGVLIVIILLFHKKMDAAVKKVAYILIVAVTGGVTIYLIFTTLHLNIISVTEGPVHWHADYEIWMCGKEIRLPEPKGISNKQGTNLIHSHNDNRIHVEGVLLSMEGASLGAFFHTVGGYIASDGFSVSTDQGLIAVHNGDKCSEKPAKLYVFVNGKLINNPSAYIISPYEKVPPGDRIKVVFTEKNIEEIDKNIK